MATAKKQAAAVKAVTKKAAPLVEDAIPDKLPKRDLDLDATDPLVPAVEEAEPLEGASEDAEDAADEASLDGEEIDPFNDKWEE